MIIAKCLLRWIRKTKLSNNISKKIKIGGVKYEEK